MKCSRCSSRAVFLNPRLCKGHFVSYVEEKAGSTIRKHRLFTKKDRVAAAVSGGKDSLSLAYILSKKGYDVTAIVIDEGIRGYREKKISAMKDVLRRLHVKYTIYSFKEEFGRTLDQLAEKSGLHPCTVCGVMRRYMLNKYSKGFDVLATGHNMDDEAQAILMNLLKNSPELLARQGPVSGAKENLLFVKRVKPFYLCKEKEILAYSLLTGLDTPYIECTYAGESFRAALRDNLNSYEEKNPGTKENIIRSHSRIKKKLSAYARGNAGICEACGSPASNSVCRTCSLVRELIK